LLLRHVSLLLHPSGQTNAPMQLTLWISHRTDLSCENLAGWPPLFACPPAAGILQVKRKDSPFTN
jgi:hypothetical protein